MKKKLIAALAAAFFLASCSVPLQEAACKAASNPGTHSGGGKMFNKVAASVLNCKN